MAEDRDSLRPQGSKMAGNGTPKRSMTMTAAATTKATNTTATTTHPSTSNTTTTVHRSSPFLPTPLERLVLAAYPAILVFGAAFAALSPETRGAPYDAARQAHVPSQAPSYFARKDNVVNVLFVKRGWLWVTAAFAAFAGTHPALRQGGGRARAARAARAAARWAAVTGWWVLVTQWCLGPPLIDRGFRVTGGKCVVALEAVAAAAAQAGRKELLTAAACRAAGGRWSGGHDISGHVFLLVLGSCFLLQEVAWVLLRGGARIAGATADDDRAVVMPDGAVKGAGVESARPAAAHERHLGIGGKFALGVVGLSLWMLLMTAVYFHTWFEKLTGLLVASIGVYTVYILPRWIPAWRAVVGLPGI